ncbi:2-C-methyl-D-erythritol 2,4-cyclodiphosphate synthase [candidate division WOR-3 bacterium]|nr:2-C-methyl-D-erythritol 2,4-cyclodiphosphate synthase [candidate division WOR-3 bacterium]MCK4527027.1 2-C-methyl-D-erythritol 2,4-cyclodiphosphate synthase [candidate division WOR-3 bacterium]
MRIGFGYDIHLLKRGESLILGGVEIDWEFGLIGHSDGDVLVHSIIDSLFGAFGLPDIGRHFPDSDPKYRGISSMALLEETMRFIPGRVINIDVTVVMEEPMLSPFIDSMKENISNVIGLDDSFISIKATTNEGVGPVGEKKAIISYCVSLCNEVV